MFLAGARPEHWLDGNDRGFNYGAGIVMTFPVLLVTLSALALRLTLSH